jgi:phosphoribosylformylglycinamidine (FGAM) synthase-like enzyme
MLAQSDRRGRGRRWRPPTTSISAIPNGLRSWASWSWLIEGIGEACRALDFPIVSGNVSLYNETNGEAILPTPTIGGVGLIPDWSQMARIGGAAPGDVIILIGGDGTHLGQTAWLRDCLGRSEGAPPPPSI